MPLKVIILEIAEIHYHKTITVEVRIEIIRNNITVGVIIDHIHHSVTETNNTRPEANTITDRMIDKITVVEAIIEAVLHVEECSPTVGRLVMTKEVIKLNRGLRKLLHIRDIPKMNHEAADVGFALTMNRAFQDSAGQPQ